MTKTYGVACNMRYVDSLYARSCMWCVCVLNRDGTCDVMCLRVSPNSRLIAGGFSNGEVKVFMFWVEICCDTFRRLNGYWDESHLNVLFITRLSLQCAFNLSLWPWWTISRQRETCSYPILIMHLKQRCAQPSSCFVARRQTSSQHQTRIFLSYLTDVSPVDYRILTVLQEWVCQHLMRDIDKLRQCLIDWLSETDDHWSGD